VFCLRTDYSSGVNDAAKDILNVNFDDIV